MLFTGDKDTREGLKESIARHIKSQVTFDKVTVEHSCAVESSDKILIETMFMKNKKTQWRLIVSCQITFVPYQQ